MKKFDSIQEIMNELNSISKDNKNFIIYFKNHTIDDFDSDSRIFMNENGTEFSFDEVLNSLYDAKMVSYEVIDIPTNIFQFTSLLSLVEISINNDFKEYVLLDNDIFILDKETLSAKVIDLDNLCDIYNDLKCYKQTII